MNGETVVIRGDALVDARHQHTGGASVWIRGDRIAGVYGHDAPPIPVDAQVVDVPGGCILPGMIDVHVHLMLGTAERHSGPKTYNHVMDEDTDGLMLLRCVRNGYRHLLRSGVTTMRDAGARNRVTFDLKDGLQAGLFRGFPTVHACGRSITITGGHFHFCGEEADGEDAC